MTEVDITGGTELQKKLVHSAACYYVNFLMGAPGQLLLTIRLKPHLFQKYGCKADCLILDEDEDFREFEIRIDSKMHIPAILRCLAHECVHVSQYQKRHLRDGNSAFHNIWKGKAWDVRKHHYYDLPWEREAYGMEVGLFERFVAAKRFTKKRWYKDYDYA